MRKVMLIAVSVAALAAGVAVAQPGEQRGPGGGHGAMLMRADANNDGVITRAEFDTAHAAHFAQLDGNHDGTVTREEHRAQRRAMHEARQGGNEGGHGRHGRGGRDGARDANNDGNISREEFLAGPTEHFNRIDANHDGTLSQAELTAQREARGERREQWREARQRMNPDANNDGNITRAEFDAQGARHFQALDANSDGRVTREEIQAARPQRRG